MSKIRCFFLEPSQRAQVSLRRWRDSERYLRNPDGSFITEKHGDKEVLVKDKDYNGVCPKHTYCDASVAIGECDFSNRAISITNEMRLDPKWPKACDCGYEFKPEDHWQWNELQLYKRMDTGELIILGAAPVGAMWYAPWYEDHEPVFYKGPDGKILMVKTPGGDWCIDQRANNGPRDAPGWKREGVPPDVTATPSIGMGEGMKDYHGWLTNGYLIEC